MSTEIAKLLREHVRVGGTYWDHERRTTYAKCQCGARCYLVNQADDHAQHLADLLAARDRRVRAEALREAAGETRRMPADPDKAADWLRARADRTEAAT